MLRRQVLGDEGGPAGTIASWGCAAGRSAATSAGRSCRGAILVAFTVNELDEQARERLLERLLAAARRRARVLVIEPIARRPFPWWDAWAEDFVAAGGRADSWRFRGDLPERLRLLDRAAGLDHRELTGRSLWMSLTGGKASA